MLGCAIDFSVPMCSSQVLLGLESSALARLRYPLLRDDVFELSPVRGCKNKRYIQFISTYEQIHQHQYQKRKVMIYMMFMLHCIKISLYYIYI